MGESGIVAMTLRLHLIATVLGATARRAAQRGCVCGWMGKWWRAGQHLGNCSTS